MVYLDYSKAFDLVPHLQLIEKLKGYGIGGNLLLWLKSFLHSRSQRVVLNGTGSQWSDITSGVPQESVLEQLLFVLNINDIAEFIKCQLGVLSLNLERCKISKTLGTLLPVLVLLFQ